MVEELGSNGEPGEEDSGDALTHLFSQYLVPVSVACSRPPELCHMTCMEGACPIQFPEPSEELVYVHSGLSGQLHIRGQPPKCSFPASYLRVLLAATGVDSAIPKEASMGACLESSIRLAGAYALWQRLTGGRSLVVQGIDLGPEVNFAVWWLRQTGLQGGYKTASYSSDPF